MKNGKIIIITLMCVMLLGACENISETPDIQSPLESDYGRISISLTGEKTVSRTVLPEIEFDKYVYTFTKAGEETGVEETPDEEGFFTLGVGNYTVAVQAFVGEEEPYTLAASGVSEQFTVLPNNNEPVIVFLSAANIVGQGMFNYTITFPAGVSAEVTLQKWPELGDGIPLTPGNVTEGNGVTETLELESGSYILTVLVQKSDLYAGISEAVHINSSQSTVYTKNFTENDFLFPQYMVTFDINEATSGTVPDARTISSGSSITLPGGSGFTRDGYVFDGWNTVADGTGTNYDAGTSYTVTENVTLYAKWEVAYTVSFSANNGVEVIFSTQKVKVGSSITLPGGTDLSRTGYTFKGWNTNSSGTGTDYAANALYTPTENSTLYAKWDIIVYTITFNVAGGTGTTPDTQKVNAGSRITLPSGSGLSRTGYGFGGWNTSASGTGTNYNAGYSFVPANNITLYANWVFLGTEASPFPLNENLWADGSIITEGGEVWYTFFANAGTTYHVWWNDYSYGDGTKTQGVYVTAYDSNRTVLFDRTYSGWGSPRTITLISGSTIYLRVTHRSGSIGNTFAIGYSTNTTKSNFRIKPPTNHISLVKNQWTNDSITAAEGEIWYSFTAAANTNYGIWWNDKKSGDSTKTLDAAVRAYDSNGTQLFNVDSSFVFNMVSTISVNSSGTIYLRVIPYYGVGNGTGTFSILYSTGFIRPDIGHAPLTENQWKNGSVGTWGESWYTFTANAGTTYRVWWNDYSYGDGTKTEGIYVTAYDSNRTVLFDRTYGGWGSPRTITLISGSTIYLRVTHLNGSIGGTFAIGYSTGTTRP